ncbi:alpha/beta fold hydrolase [Halorussus caseinilyticus]|uniref:Alpha/beta fold hydrolase n=1 Tax=Halorussus caseinilyticus TaxID=3034025 RepID=A0ABD5WI12_9EURY|nr:alpha/beta hydrolase [Halorussus sp. DT72]
MERQVSADSERGRGADGPWTHGHAVVDDVRLHYVAAGDEDDPLVVLLHGFPDFWNSWRDQIPALADAGYRVVAPDMRGYNRSEKPHGVEAYRVERLVGDVAGLVEYFGREQAHVVGHDWGGIVAWETASRRPEVVEKLAVLNAPHFGRYREVLRDSPEQRRRSWYAAAFQIPWLPETLLGAFECAGIGALLRATADPDTFSEADLRRYREAICRPGALTAALNYYRALARDGLREEIGALLGRERPPREVPVPTQIIWGEADSALVVEQTENLERWVPDLRVERLPGVTHWVQKEAPEEVTELLAAFFAE